MSTAKKYKWHKIADATNEFEFAANNLLSKEVAGKKITLAKYNEKLFACAAKCPHAGGVLADGNIDALGNIVCPLHRYKYNLANGRNTSGEGYYLSNYPVEVREDGVYVGFEEKGFFNWLTGKFF